MHLQCPVYPLSLWTRKSLRKGLGNVALLKLRAPEISNA